MATNNPYALSFDGVDDYAEALNNLSSDLSSIDKNFTVELIVQPSSVSASYQRWWSEDTIIEYRRLSSSGGPIFNIGITNGKLFFGRSDRSTEIGIVTSGAPFSTGESYRVVITLENGTGVSFYVFDSTETLVLEETATITELSAQTGGDHCVKIGSRSKDGGGAASYYNGICDDVRIYDFVKTKSEITNTAFSYIGDVEPNLVGHWRCDEGSGSVVDDLAHDTSENELTITGATWVTGTLALNAVSVSGNITISGSAVEGAKVILINSTNVELLGTQITDSNGYYEFLTLPVTKVYHALVEYEDANGQYNAESLPFLNS